MENRCKNCGAPLSDGSNVCQYCGAVVDNGKDNASKGKEKSDYDYSSNQNSSNYSQTGNNMNQQAYSYTQDNYVYMEPAKNKIVAGILAIIFGFIGVHKFYLGKTGQGVLCVLFCWTGIPAVIGFIEGIVYLCTSDENWARKVGYRY